MAKILSFPQSARKHGYRRVRKRRRVDLEKYGQLNMFSKAKEAKVVQFTANENLFDQALFLEEDNQLERAEEIYQEAAKQSAFAADANCNLGILKSQQSELVSAIDYFTRALIQDPRHYEAHYNLANIYADQGNNSLAQLHYEIAIRVNPSFDSAYYNLAILYMQEGKLEEAENRLMQYKTLADDADKVTAETLLSEIRNHINKRYHI